MSTQGNKLPCQHWQVTELWQSSCAGGQTGTLCLGVCTGAHKAWVVILTISTGLQTHLLRLQEDSECGCFLIVKF